MPARRDRVLHGGFELGVRRRRQAQERCRPFEAREVLAQLERHAVVHAERLEDGASAQHALVVGMHRRLVDGHDTTAELRQRDERHDTGAASGAPIAASSGRALTHDSSTSSAGSESQTMPPPTQR